MKFLNINWGSRLAAAVVVWGATAYHYINTGMSISMIAFTLFVIAYALKNHAIPKVTLHKNILWAFAVFYACLFIHDSRIVPSTPALSSSFSLP